MANSEAVLLIAALLLAKRDRKCEPNLWVHILALEGIESRRQLGRQGQGRPAGNDRSTLMLDSYFKLLVESTRRQKKKKKKQVGG